MARYLLYRLAASGLMMLLVLSAVFLLARAIPGDPVEIMLGESADPAARRVLAEAMGLERPLHVQWWRYMQRLARLDMGHSIYSGRNVTSLLAEHIPATVLLACAALAIAVTLALPLGVLAALAHGRLPDRLIVGSSLLGIGIPNFCLGPLLILLGAFTLGLFPVGGMTGPASIVLPALTLGTGMAALLIRMIRANLLEVMHAQFLRAAGARGAGQVRALLCHALPNALLPVVTIFGLQVGALLTGAVVTEQIFAWPGVGQLTMEAITRRDYPLIQGCILLISGCFVLVNLFTDLAYAALDPRIRLEERGLT